ncbi:MAG TPA: serine hydrolase [Solirubrobacteraceae bacterium]
MSFAVRTEDRAWGFRATRGVPAASTLKAMLLVAYLRRPDIRRRALRRADRALLAPMIRRSDNVAATRVRDIVTTRGVARFARRAGMKRFHPHPVWGLSRVDAADLATFMLDVDRLTPRRHRRYAMRLLGSVVSSQRWGIARAKPPGWKLYFKGGWGSGTGAVDHQVALLTRGEERVAVAITTTGNGSHAAGKRTLRGVARRLLRGLAR